MFFDVQSTKPDRLW